MHIQHVVTQRVTFRTNRAGVLGLFLLLWLTACHNAPPAGQIPAVVVDESTVRDHRVGPPGPLRLSDTQWGQLNGEPCGGNHFLAYELTISASGMVESATLLPYTGSCNFVPHSPNPPPVVMARLKQAEDLIRAQRFVPWEIDGHPARVLVRTSLALAPPERFGPPRPFPALTDVPDFSMTLARRGCEGRCPVYSVTVAGDGTVTYKGFAYVAVQGSQRDHISTLASMELLDRFRQANFLAALPSYSGAYDGGYNVLTLQMGEKRYEVVDESGLEVGLPDAIFNLEEAMDKSTQSARWVKGK